MSLLPPLTRYARRRAESRVVRVGLQDYCDKFGKVFENNGKSVTLMPPPTSRGIVRDRLHVHGLLVHLDVDSFAMSFKGQWLKLFGCEKTILCTGLSNFYDQQSMMKIFCSVSKQPIFIKSGHKLARCSLGKDGGLVVESINTIVFLGIETSDYVRHDKTAYALCLSELVVGQRQRTKYAVARLPHHLIPHPPPACI